MVLLACSDITAKWSVEISKNKQNLFNKLPPQTVPLLVLYTLEEMSKVLEPGESGVEPMRAEAPASKHCVDSR